MPLSQSEAKQKQKSVTQAASVCFLNVGFLLYSPWIYRKFSVSVLDIVVQSVWACCLLAKLES